MKIRIVKHVCADGVERGILEYRNHWWENWKPLHQNGKRYGFYPDGSLYRIYSTTDRPFLEIVDIEGETFLRIRQATELGYTDFPVFGVADLNYPTSALRRSRTIGGVSW